MQLLAHACMYANTL